MKRSRDASTKLVCTIGPVSSKLTVLRKLNKAGMDICRMNFSHGSHGDHLENYQRIRSLEGDPAVLIDLCGPKIRTGEVQVGTKLETGSKFRISAEIGIEGNSKVTGINYPPLVDDAQIGNHLAIDDGLILLRVVEKDENELVCTVLNGGELKSRKGINAPDVPLSAYFPTEKDMEDVNYILRKFEEPPDYIAASFVRRKEDIDVIREILKDHNSPSKIISKIENRDGIKNFDEILESSDGIMVARGDLGIEIPAERVPIVQKELIKKCNQTGKPVIVATQMLDSMIRNPRPTRAEVSDVSNAIIDGADAVMLSGETAAGKYPLEAVQYIEKILREIPHQLITKHNTYDSSTKILTSAEALGQATQMLSEVEALGLDAIVTSTRTGSTTRLIAKFRPGTKIVAGTPYRAVKRQLNLIWGVFPILVDVTPNYDELVYNIVRRASEIGLLSSDNMILIVGGSLLGFPSKTNQIQLLEVEDVLLYGEQLKRSVNV
ncbi:MAG: pyruvate kinase [Candidatus Thorarchaeota archaeon]